MKKYIVFSAMVLMVATACNDNQENATRNEDPAEVYEGSQATSDSIRPQQDSVVVPVHEQHKDSSVMTSN